MPAVQRWLTGKVVEYLSDKLKTKVSLKGLDISIFDHLVLEELYIEDRQKDTLLFVDYLGINIKTIRIRKSIFSFDKLRLKELVFNLKYDTAGVMNMQFILDAFASSEPPDTTASEPSTFKVDRIQIENSRFSYFIPDSVHLKPDSTDNGGVMNFNDLKLTNLNFDAKNLIIGGSSIMLDIDSVSMTDKCGFRLHSLSSNLYYGDTRIDLSRLKLITDNSKLYFDKLKITYASFDDFNDFENKVRLNLRIADSTSVGLKDVAFFSSSLKGFDQNIGFAAIINGPLSDLNVPKLEVTYGQNTRLSTNFTIKGLPDIEKANFHIQIDTLTSSIFDVNSIKDPSDPKKSIVALPTSIASVGKIYYKGNISGNLAKIVTKGKLITGIGVIDSKINIEQKNNGYTNIYGSLVGKNLEISDIINNKDIGKFDITDTLDFKISPKGEIEGVSNGRVNNLQLMGYSYQTVTFDAIINKYVYQAELKITDPNLDLRFDGMFVTNDEQPKLKFNSEIKKFVPYRLHLYDDSLFTAKVNMNGSAIGLDPDVLTGKFICEIEELTNQYGKIKNKKIIVKSDFDKIDSVRTLQISSDFVDVKLWGDIKPTTLASSFEKYLHTLMPSLSDTLKTPTIENKDSLYIAITAENNFDFEIKVKDLKALRTMFFPDIDIKQGTKLSGKFNLMPGNFQLDVYCPEANVSGTKIEEFILNGDNRDEKLNFYINTRKIFITETNSLDNSLINAYIYKDNFYVDFIWNTFLDSLNYSGDVSMIMGLENRPNKPSLIKLRLDSSSLSFQESQWTINSNEILIDSNFIDLGNIVFKSKKNEKLYIGGKISESSKDTVKVEIEKLNLGLIDMFIKDMGLGLTGEFNGTTYISGVMGDLMVKSVDSISNLYLSGIRVGDLRLNALWDNKSSKADLYAETQLLNIKNLVVKGQYLVDKDYLDFKVDIERLPFEIAEPFIKDYISQIDGKISGKVTVKGNSKNPDIQAGFKFVRAGFLVNQLQTYYSFTDSLFIDNNSIKLKKMQLNAGRNSYAWLEGSISHKNFDDIKIDMSLDARNFLFLKTVETDTTSFYGTVFASGGIGLKGDVDNMDINIKLKTEKGTRFYLPLGSSSEVSESNYITFIKPDTLSDENKQEEHTVNLSGFNINFELEATSDAEMQIIMDETVGDMIKVRGMGNLDIKVNKVGDIFLYGTYSITKGDYLFTLQNLVNKKFEVDQGSTISWNGDPYNAIMDMTAVYKIRKVPLYDLMQDPNYKEMKTNVECNLSMTGSLMDPGIGFGLALPEAKEPVISNVNGLAQDDLNQQILSLLILGKFQPLPSVQSTDAAAAGGNPLSNNAFEMLSNQLSNWLSKISDDLDIGVNYKQGGEMTSDEVEVALSTQLFNDRISINTNVGVGGGTSTQTNQGETNSANKIVGDVEIEIKLNKKGSLRSKVFNRANQKTENNSEQGLYTQGIGVFYRKEFNSASELAKEFWKTVTLQKMKEKKKKKNNLNKDINRKEEKQEKPDNSNNSNKPDNTNKDIKKEEEKVE